MIQTYSERLTLAMRRQGVNVTALAKALGLTYQGVKRVVDGHSKAFTAANNDRAAKYLGVSPGWLATGNGDMTTGAIDTHDLWPFTRISQSKYFSLSNRDKKLLEDIALAMIAESDISTPHPDIQGAMEKVANLAKGDKDEELRGMQASGGGKH